jgi:hypothetical protein
VLYRKFAHTIPTSSGQTGQREPNQQNKRKKPGFPLPRE